MRQCSCDWLPVFVVFAANVEHVGNLDVPPRIHVELEQAFLIDAVLQSIEEFRIPAGSKRSLTDRRRHFAVQGHVNKRLPFVAAGLLKDLDRNTTQPIANDGKKIRSDWRRCGSLLRLLDSNGCFEPLY